MVDLGISLLQEFIVKDWKLTHIVNSTQANLMIGLFKKQKPIIGAFDSETNGLHIIQSQPFFFQFGWIDIPTQTGYVYSVDIEKQPDLATQTIRIWNDLASSLKIYLAHNTKFDLHMLANLGLPYTTENVSDTMFFIRAAHDARTVANGGPPMGLKDYTARYIDASAKTHDKLLQTERSNIAKQINANLKIRLASCGRPPAEYGAASYTIGVIDKIFSDPIASWESFPTKETRQAYDDWLNNDVPLSLRSKVTGLVTTDMIPYNWCDRHTLTKYAHLDIVYVLKVFFKTLPVIKQRDNFKLIDIENSLILPLFEMERVGFAADKEYLLECRTNVKEYIIQRRKKLYELADRVFSIGQHAVIMEILNDLTLGNLAGLDNTRDETLSRIKSDLKAHGTFPKVVEFISVLQELRTLEKWYSTYILRFINDLKSNDRLYTTINQVGAVSGRVTSDFQQFPKGGIKTVDGKELFHPRRLIKASGGKYKAIVYLDYSQIELRFQALYTILVGHPDLNLCRAYMPYKCINIQKELFDVNKPEHINSWDKEWYYEEKPDEHWQATDVHGATTTAAFGIDKTDPTFHDLRYVGKRVNFAKRNLLTKAVNFVNINLKELML